MTREYRPRGTRSSLAGSVLVCWLALVPTACGPLDPSVWRGPYRGTVVDAETEEPISGAVVQIIWLRLAPASVAHASASYHGSSEAITNEEGSFDLPGPPMLWVPLTRLDEPWIRFFKGGYVSFADNGRQLGQAMDRGQPVIPLRRAESYRERHRAWALTQTHIVPAHEMPLMSKALSEEWEVLRTLEASK